MGLSLSHRTETKPLIPFLGKELRKPVAVNASLAVEEPDKAEHVTVQTGSRDASDHTVSGEIAGPSGDHSVHEEVGPGAMIGKEHGSAGVDRLGLLHDVETGLKQASNLRRRPERKLPTCLKIL